MSLLNKLSSKFGALGGFHASTSNVAAPTYTISGGAGVYSKIYAYGGSIPSYINAGYTAVYSINTTGVPGGTTLYWKDTGTRANSLGSSAYVDGLTSGSFSLSGSSQSLMRVPSATQNGDGTMIINIFTDSGFTNLVASAAPLTISNKPTWSLSPDVTTVNEGTAVTYTATLSSALMYGGSTFYWKDTGTRSINGFTDVSKSGSFTIMGSQSGTFTRTPSANNFTDGSTNMILDLYDNASYVGSLATASTVTVNDTSTTPAPSFFSPYPITSVYLPSSGTSITASACVSLSFANSAYATAASTALTNELDKTFILDTGPTNSYPGGSTGKWLIQFSGTMSLSGCNMSGIVNTSSYISTSSASGSMVANTWSTTGASFSTTAPLSPTGSVGFSTGGDANAFATSVGSSGSFIIDVPSNPGGSSGVYRITVTGMTFSGTTATWNSGSTPVYLRATSGTGKVSYPAYVAAAASVGWTAGLTNSGGPTVTVNFGTASDATAFVNAFASQSIYFWDGTGTFYYYNTNSSINRTGATTVNFNTSGPPGTFPSYNGRHTNYISYSTS